MMKINITHQSNSISFEMEKTLPEHEAFGVLRAFTVSAFQDLPDPLVYSLADAEQDFGMQEPKDWKEGVQKHFKGDEINLTIVNEQDSDSESESWVITAQEEEVQGDETAPVEDEKAPAEAEPEKTAEVEEEGADKQEEVKVEEEATEQPQQPGSVRTRIMQFVSEIGGEGMQNLVAVTHSLVKEGVSISDAFRTAVETSDVAASHPFTQDLFAILAAYADRMQPWIPCMMNFNIDHMVAMIPNIVETITQALEGKQDVELDIAPIFQMCNPQMMAHLQRLIPNGEERTFNVDRENPFAVFQEAEAAVEEEFAPEPKVVHRGVVCDGCEMDPIVGVRYKSTLRSNYDLCEECEKKHDENDPLLKIKKPIGEIDLLPGMSEFGNQMASRGRHCRRGRGRGRRGGCRMFRRCGPGGPRCMKMMREMKEKFMEEMKKNGTDPCQFMMEMKKKWMEQNGGKDPCQFMKEMKKKFMEQNGGCPFNQNQEKKSEPKLDRRDPTKAEVAPEVIEDEQPSKEEAKKQKKQCKKLIRAAKKEVKALRKSAKCLKKCKSKEASEKAEEILRTAEAKQKFVQEVRQKMRENKAQPLDSKVVAHLDMELKSTQEPGSCTLKTWKVKNTGSEAWPVETYAVFVGGNQSLLPEGYSKVYVGPLNVGDVAYIRVMINVPEVPGSYSVGYKLITIDGKFGQKMRTVVNVEKAMIKPEMVRQERAESIQSAIEEPSKDERSESIDSLASATEDDFPPNIDRASSIATAVSVDIPDQIDDEEAPEPSAPRLTEPKYVGLFKYKHAEKIEALKAMGFNQDDETLNSLLVV